MGALNVLMVAHMLASAAPAQSMPVPADLQGALFKKILKYDKTLRAKGGSLSVLVVHDGDSGTARAVAGAFEKAGITATVADVGSADSAASGVSAVYAATPGAASKVSSLCKRKRLLSLTGYPGLVERGSIAVGLGKGPRGRPEIVVHTGRLADEGHELSSNLLGLAKLIK